jgi:hypothetical protein
VRGSVGEVFTVVPLRLALTYFKARNSSGTLSEVKQSIGVLKV